ncbi:MAG: hypothetical protein ACI8X5_001811 [Planctomycetota bacterium]|jgi:hypothetical protein
MGEFSSIGSRLAIVLVTVVLALVARLGYDINRTLDPATGEWVSIEADSFYHMRRLDRLAQEGWPIAGEDPMLDFPDGAEIPWPPYYTGLLGMLTMPFSEDETERRLHIEHFVASITVLFGVLCALFAALAAYRLSGIRGAAFAGPCAALALCAVVYSSIGNGDHHAFVAFLHAAILTLLTFVIGGSTLDSRRRSLCAGVIIGGLAGLGLGSWVAFLPYIVEVDLVLAILLMLHTRRSYAGLAVFGLAFHLSALAVLAYAALTSPWLATQPWMVINLSYFHLFFLGVGAVVFAPLIFSKWEERLRPRYPLIVFTGLVLLAGTIAMLNLGPARGVREAFLWASGEDKFMASIQESRSFFSALGEGTEQLLISLGYGVLLLPFAWVAAVVACVRGKRELLPWIVAVPLLLLQALSQLRFAEALVVPLAVVVGWSLANLLGRFVHSGGARRVLATSAAVILGVGLQGPGIAEGLTYRRAASTGFETTEIQASTGSARRMCDWLREREVHIGREAVLSTWGYGHMIEWVTQRPTVATNFGSYLGLDSYTAPALVFLSEDDDELERQLEERQVGHLLLTSRITLMLPDMIARAKPELAREYLGGPLESWRGGLQPRWFQTAMARLLLSASTVSKELPASARRPFGFLRLVHIARENDPLPGLRGIVSRSARGWIWERVDGVHLAASGEPGAEFRVQFEINYPKARTRILFEDQVRLDAQGQGTLRVPYSTLNSNGDGRVLPGASYWIGSKRAALAITEAMVVKGETLELR